MVKEVPSGLRGACPKDEGEESKVSDNYEEMVAEMADTIGEMLNSLMVASPESDK